MNNFRRLAAVLTICLILVACSDNTPASSGSASSGSTATAASGEFPPMGPAELDAYLADNKGTPTMVMVWTTWCPSCKQQMPEMEELAKSAKGQINVITVSLDENVEILKDYFKDKKLDLPVYHGDEALARKYEVQAIPTLLMFDREGKLNFNKPGVFPTAMLKVMADKLAQQ